MDDILIPFLGSAGGAGAIFVACRAAIVRLYVDFQSDRREVLDHLRAVQAELAECRAERAAFEARLDARDRGN